MATLEVIRRFGVWARQGGEDVRVGEAYEYEGGMIGVYFEPGAKIRADYHMLELAPEVPEDRPEDWRDAPTEPMVLSEEITRPGMPHNVVRPTRKGDS